MDFEGILVSFQLKGSEVSSVASGILFQSDFVLLTGAILFPLLHEQKEWVALFLESSSYKLETNKHIRKVLFRVYGEVKKNDETNKVSDPKLAPRVGNVVKVWKCDLVARSLNKFFRDWTLGSSRDSSEADIDASKELMSIFIILKCEGGEKQGEDKPGDDISALYNLVSGLMEPHRGQEIEIVSTPFGSRHLLNSLSRGVISNVVGIDKCLILTDARTVSGCEGGPMFATIKSSGKDKRQGKLLGLVTCPLTYWRGEWVGLTIGINLVPVLKSLLSMRSDPIGFPRLRISQCAKSNSNLIRVVDETVVLIRNESSWGSGVVLNAASGTILTCSHVVKNNGDVSILHKKGIYPAAVVFRTRDDIAYDLAIIKPVGASVFEKEIEFSVKLPKIGDSVIAAGFPFFSEADDFNLQPSLVSGCISRVHSFMIQTTCCIQSGFSGGPLLKDGKLLGIVVSNALDTTTGALFPHINFVIPSSVFREHVLNYIKADDVLSLKVLESSNPKVQSFWTLQFSKL